ncbi:MAG: DUF1624 domain-containing protein [Phycisphaerales bacterium]|nr:DUF1624 domain-containing protein [Phycisphaerales bacterium]
MKLPTKPTLRLRSLDAFRGLTMAAMVIVNNPGSWATVYAPLLHAKWHGLTPTDLIFPFFLFIVGSSMAFSSRTSASTTTAEAIKNERSAWLASVIRRSAVLIALGLALNLAGPVLDALLHGNWSAFSSTRLPGVLQRIGLCYFAAAVIVRLLSLRSQIVLGALTLLAYGLLLAFGPSLIHPASTPSDLPIDPLSDQQNLCRWFDGLIIPAKQLYKTGSVTDPEGLLSTLPSIVSVLIGYWCGLLLKGPSTTETSNPAPKSRFVQLNPRIKLSIVGMALTLAGYTLSLAQPLNKSLWTPSYTLFTAGAAAILLAGMSTLLDGQNKRRIALPLEVLGLNAILLFVGSGVLARLLGTIHVGVKPDGKPLVLKDWLFQLLLNTGLPDKDASLAFAMLNLLLWLVVLSWLYRRRWFWKV